MKGLNIRPIQKHATFLIKDFTSEVHTYAAAFTQLAIWIDEYEATSYGYIYIPKYGEDGVRIGTAGIEVWIQSNNEKDNATIE